MKSLTCAIGILTSITISNGIFACQPHWEEDHIYDQIERKKIKGERHSKYNTNLAKKEAQWFIDTAKTYDRPMAYLGQIPLNHKVKRALKRLMIEELKK